MNLCKKSGEGYVHPEIVTGHLYRNGLDQIYIAVSLPLAHIEVLTSLETGIAWNSYSPFGDDIHQYNQWKDVTDQYCLMEK